MRVRAPESVVSILAVLRLLPGLGRGRTILLAGGVLVAAIAPVAAGVVTGVLIGSIPATAQAGFSTPAGHRTVTLLILVAALVLVDRGTSPLLAATAATLGRDLDRSLQEKVMAAVNAPSGIAHLEDEQVLDEIRTVRGLGMDAMRPSQAVTALPGVLPAWLRALGSAAVLLAFHWWLGLLWLVVWPLLVFVMQREYLRVGQVGYGQSTALRRSEYLRDLALTTAAAKEIRLWGMLDWLVQQFQQAWRTAIEPVWAARRPRRGVVAGTAAVILVVNAVSYGVLAYAAVRGDIGLAALAVYSQALIGANGYTAFNDDNAHLSFGGAVVPRIEQMHRRLALPRAAGSSVRPSAHDATVRFEHVGFRYPGSDRTVLDDLTLELPVGQSMAIVGQNGAGKTSLVKLLCGLYRPTSGRVCIGGTDVQDLDPEVWRHQIAVLFQDFARWHLPVRDNIGFGAVEHAGDLDRIRAAAVQAGILDYIESLPRGWDTVLSREYTGGTDLSGGQWQRIALARAMFAVDAGARILILDEPTAALDVRAEAELYDRFLELTAGLTTCLISHRFSTVRRADRIVVLAGGQVAETGDHDQLMALGGRYATLFTLQAQRFTGDGRGSDHG